MIAIALIIHFTRTQTLQDLQATLISIMSGGLLGLFSARPVDSTRGRPFGAAGHHDHPWRGSPCAVHRQPVRRRTVPSLAALLPDKFWIIVLANTFLLCWESC